MRFPALAVTSLLAIGFASSAGAAAEIDPDMRVVIRTYDNAALPASDLASAVTTATTILQASGLGTAWHACEVAFVRDTAHPCAAPLRTNEIAVRIVRLTTDTTYRGELSLGYSLVDTATRSGTLATIYIDRVAWLSEAAGVDLRLVLGRALAHEVGHLLLGTNAHSESGVMRAVWSCKALKRNVSRDWLFAKADAGAMRQAVRLRAAPQLARLGIGD